MPKNSARELTVSAMVAAIYAVLTMVLPIPQYAGVQLRLAEGLCVLPFLFSGAAPGLFVGCMVANLLSPFGFLDVVAGSLATLLACRWTQRLKNRWLVPIPAAVCNALIVGGVVTFSMTGFGESFWPAFILNALTIAIGELIVGYTLGQLLLEVLPTLPPVRRMMDRERLDLLDRCRPLIAQR